MPYHTTDRDGITRINPPEREWHKILASLEDADPADAPEVWLTNDDSGWGLSVYGSGLVVLENDLSGDPPRRRTGVSRDEVMRLWRLLAAGDIEALQSEPWEPLD